MEKYNTKIFKNGILLSLNIKQWNARKRGDKAIIDTDADKSMLGLSKKLMDKKECPEYAAVMNALDRMYYWVKGRSVPSFFRAGFNLIRREGLQEIVDRIRDLQDELEKDLIPAFCKVYLDAVKEVQRSLKSQWNPMDYPGISYGPDGRLQVDTRYIAAKFGLSYNVLSLDIPDDLTEEMRAEEERKIKDTFSKAEGMITATLYQGLDGVLNDLITRLSDSEDGKKKRFTCTIFDRLAEFIDTFKTRDLLDDEQLGDLVSRSREIHRLAGSKDPAKAVKENDALRREMAGKFGELQGQVSGALEDMPTRSFDFNE